MATEVNSKEGKSQRDVTRDLLKKTLIKQAEKADFTANSKTFMAPRNAGQSPQQGGNDMPTFNYQAATATPSRVPLVVESYDDLPPVRTVKKVNRKTIVESTTTKSLASLLESMGESLIEEGGGKFNLVEYTTLNDNKYNVVFQHVVGESSMQIQCSVDLMDEESVAAVTTSAKGLPYSQTITRVYATPDKLVEDLSGLLEVTQRICQ